MSYRVCLIGLLMVLLGPAPSFAELKMLVTPNGDGAFFLVGDNFNGVTAVDVVIEYDTASLANPQVAAEGGTLTYVYAGTPGTLLVSAIRENPDAAFYLDLKFEKTGASPGVIKKVNVTIKDTEGKNSPVPDATIIPFSPSQDPTTATESDNGAGAVLSAGEALETRQEGGVYQGRLDGGTDTGAGNDAAFSETGAAVKPEQPAAAQETNVSPPPLRHGKSVLRRFEEFRGAKGMRELTDLFKRPDQETITQEPAIALSNGKTPVRIRLKLHSNERHAPDVSLSDAKLVSLSKTDEKNWILTALPRKGAWNVSVILRNDKNKLEFPLVVAPPIKIRDGINEKNFLIALNEYVADQIAGQKGKNGPFTESFHEYVFTANYLANQARKVRLPVR